MEPDFCGRIGFAGFNLTNNNANIRRLKLRLADLEKRSEQETTEKEENGITIIDNVEENRLQLFFPGKPCEEIRTDLKSSGFRWSRFNGCWQRHRSNAATWNAERIIKHYKDLEQ